jgi:general stress protein YciG
MKKIFTAVFTMLLACALAFGQTGGDKKTLNPQPLPPGAHATADTAPAHTTGKKGGKKHHKGGKKSKKGGSTTSTPVPK